MLQIVFFVSLLVITAGVQAENLTFWDRLAGHWQGQGVNEQRSVIGANIKKTMSSEMLITTNPSGRGLSQIDVDGIHTYKTPAMIADFCNPWSDVEPPFLGKETFFGKKNELFKDLPPPEGESVVVSIQGANQMLIRRPSGQETVYTLSDGAKKLVIENRYRSADGGLEIFGTYEFFRTENTQRRPLCPQHHKNAEVISTWSIHSDALDQTFFKWDQKTVIAYPKLKTVGYGSINKGFVFQEVLTGEVLFDVDLSNEVIVCDPVFIPVKNKIQLVTCTNTEILLVSMADSVSVKRIPFSVNTSSAPFKSFLKIHPQGFLLFSNVNDSESRVAAWSFDDPNPQWVFELKHSKMIHGDALIFPHQGQPLLVFKHGAPIDFRKSYAVKYMTLNLTTGQQISQWQHDLGGALIDLQAFPSSKDNAMRLFVPYAAGLFLFMDPISWEEDRSWDRIRSDAPPHLIAWQGQTFQLLVRPNDLSLYDVQQRKVTHQIQFNESILVEPYSPPRTFALGRSLCVEILKTKIGPRWIVDMETGPLAELDLNYFNEGLRHVFRHQGKTYAVTRDVRASEFKVFQLRLP
ncbi:MAG: hypothetical protein H6626_08350 [Pseudobdellovibrionaceae bacterium]|nr:hypothetical protein [Bdellovibrionales bacterium]USN46233.1 MAG: hypothetical protein H6626_08350 [Pseudobdellovibrionaceae bacterium]